MKQSNKNERQTVRLAGYVIIEKIKKALTEEYTHDYAITRDEAKQIGLPVTIPDASLEDLIMNFTSVIEMNSSLKYHLIRTPSSAKTTP